ncbi:MAG: nitrate reductase subunit alpha, partial [Desulfovibrionaceae bacterium]
LRYFTQRLREIGSEAFSDKNYSVRRGGRSWEEYYRRRWQHDKVTRSTHGNNCTGSCSFDVFVKDGIIVWEAQKTDYPTPHPDFPDYEPRGCPRGTSASWYVYSPLRVRHPLIRGALWELWQQALHEHSDPVLAWKSLVNDPLKRGKYQQARGMGGFVRVSWDDVAELTAASLVYTIQKYGPDRIFGFTPLPAMSMTSFASGARFFSLIGASMVSFYDWYCDLPPASPQIWGEQTDVPESADWYNAGYIIAWGSNLPQTRTPDAHFYTEARYRGTRIAAISPDYADFTKFADHWLPVRAGTDAALTMAMVHVIIKEFFLDRQVPYFQEYARRFTDLSCLVLLDTTASGLAAGRFVRASDLGRAGNNPQWKIAVFDTLRYGPAVPMGSVGSRYGEEGTWNLQMRDCYDGEELEPLLTMADHLSAEWACVDFPLFTEGEASTRSSAVPYIYLELDGTIQRVTTVFDILAGSVAVNRGHGGQVAKNYNDASTYATPAWQENLSGVPRQDAIKVAREFATNAEQSRGRSMIIMGAGINHWYNNDTIYRCILSLTSLCGCQGVSGGGWAHYVGQEKVRPLAGWTTLTVASDWTGPPRLQNGTSFYYFAIDAWRYELLDMQAMCPPRLRDQVPTHPADCNALAVRLGWLPFYPQFKENSLTLCAKAEAEGAVSDTDIIAHVVKRLVSGDLQMAVEDPSHPDNVPRVMCFWRTNPLGSNVKGHEYFLKHMLGTKNAVRGEESPVQPQDVHPRPADPQGKLDLMITSEFRMSTTCVYSDIVLPAAHWYEINDLSSTDMHPFIHPFTPATDPPWEARNNWEQFKAIATAFSRLAAQHLGTCKDVVATPLLHDTPGEIAQPLGQVRDWRTGEVEAIPGKTMPSLHIVERPYADVLKMYTALGPRIRNDKGVGAKGPAWNGSIEHDLLKQRLGTVTEEGCSQGMPRLDTDRAACETILCLSPESNGTVSMRSWESVETLTGLKLSDLSAPTAGVNHTFESVTARPARALNSPIWSGIKGEQCTYSPFAQNVQRLMPFHTLSGRQHFYLDHGWMLAFGESLPVFRPPLPLMRLGETSGVNIPRTGTELVLNLLTPHSKWSIHSTYSDNLIMRTLSRGGGEIWLNNDDAASAGIQDNEWLECYNANGVFMGRALVSHRIPPGKVFIYHAQERHINTPMSPLSGTRGGTHNSLTRPFIKPTQMIGAYGQLSYAFNYYGPTGCQRDEYIVIRKAGEVSFHEN